jgi:PhzF family phenazine biosynthesis protein
VRFFTSEGELNGCGHGTVAAQAVLLQRSDAATRRGSQRTGGRTFEVVATRRADGIEVWFDQGTVAVSRPSTEDADEVCAALGVVGDLMRASPGTPRYLVAVSDREALDGLTPDLDRLARLPVLGCFVDALTGPGVAAARMFAPAIGVPEDIANANSTGCLAAHLNAPLLRVDQGDARGFPSTVLASADGGRVRVGGVAVVRAA